MRSWRRVPAHIARSSAHALGCREQCPVLCCTRDGTELRSRERSPPCEKGDMGLDSDKERLGTAGDRETVMGRAIPGSAITERRIGVDGAMEHDAMRKSLDEILAEIEESTGNFFRHANLREEQSPFGDSARAQLLKSLRSVCEQLTQLFPVQPQHRAGRRHSAPKP
jgi:hypothetical protein